jgi:glycosyltransferase involved in cell wall biosynthesis
MDYQGYGLAENAPEYPTIGFLARMIPGKGLDQLVEAFLLLCQENKLPSVRLAIGGTKIAADEPFICRQQEKIARAGLTDRVTWRPNLSFEEKVAFYQSLSVLSVPASYGEAFGLYVLEALACGVPVVEPDHAGLGELVRATGGGLLTEPNSVPDLAAKLTQILTDSALRQKLAHQGRQVALEQYSADAMAARFFGAIDSTLCR